MLFRPLCPAFSFADVDTYAHPVLHIILPLKVSSVFLCYVCPPIFLLIVISLDSSVHFSVFLCVRNKLMDIVAEMHG